METTRRQFFTAAAATPIAAYLPPCRHDILHEPAEFFILELVATRERLSPKVEYEIWRSDIRDCDICGETVPYFFKERCVLCDGEQWLLPVPPIVEKPGKVIVPVQADCKVWLDGVEIDWMAGETEVISGAPRFKQFYLS